MSYEQLKQNTVSSKNQLQPSEFVTFENPTGKGKRIMFVGNSITLHGVLPEIGWHNAWGMAASEKEKDYVHICMNHIRKTDPDAVLCICQVAEWERDYKIGSEKHSFYENARNFCPDVLVARFVENCPHEEFDKELFEKEYENLINYLDKDKKAYKIITSSFWHHPANECIKEYAEKEGLPYINISDLGERDETKAIGLFEHNGVARHPGDLGMKLIAERIIEKL